VRLVQLDQLEVLDQQEQLDQLVLLGKLVLLVQLVRKDWTDRLVRRVPKERLELKALLDRLVPPVLLVVLAQ
jgi:hypothetical protein